MPTAPTPMDPIHAVVEQDILETVKRVQVIIIVMGAVFVLLYIKVWH